MSDIPLPPYPAQVVEDAVGIWTNALTSGVGNVDGAHEGLSADQIARMRDQSGDAYLGALAAGANCDTAVRIANALHTAHVSENVGRTHLLEITGVLGAAAFLESLHEIQQEPDMTVTNTQQINTTGVLKEK